MNTNYVPDPQGVAAAQEIGQEARAPQDTLEQQPGQDGADPAAPPEDSDPNDDSDHASAKDTGDSQQSAEPPPAGEGFRMPDPEDVLYEGWPEPEDILDKLLPVPPFLDVLIPEALRPWATDVAHRMQVPLCFAGVGAMIVAGSLIGTGCGIRPKRHDDWLVIPNLWGGLVAPPGRLKSPTIAGTTEPLSWLQNIAKVSHEQAEAIYNANRAEFDCRDSALREQMKKAAKETEGMTSQSRQMPGKSSLNMDDLKKKLYELKEPEQPVLRRFKTNDTTVPKLHELLAQSHRGIMVSRDELVGLWANLEREDNKQDRAFYLETWNGYGNFTYDRIGRGSICVENLCVSIFGGIQPTKLQRYLYSAMRKGENDGFPQRFQLMVYPDDIDWEYVDEKPNDRAKIKANVIFKALAETDFTKLGATSPAEKKIPYFRFDEEAQEFFKSWLIDLERRKLNGDDEPVIIEHLAKYRSLMPTLALIDHLVKAVNSNISTPVSLESAETAAAWCNFLEQHARRIYGLVTNVRHKAAKCLSERIKAHRLLDGFTARDVYVHGWSLLDKADETQAALDELVVRNWLREATQEHCVRYYINPRIYKQ